MITGIYKILNKKNNKIYIGSAINIKKRWRDHKWYLKNNKHHNSHLQAAHNKYGIKNFEFSIILECNESELIENEIKFINQYNSKNSNFGYNINNPQKNTHLNNKRKKTNIHKMFGNDNPMFGKFGCDHPKYRYKLSKNMRNKISEISKNRIGEKSNASKLNNSDIYIIRLKYKTNKYTQNDLAKEFNVTQSTIGNVVNNKRWMNVTSKDFFLFNNKNGKKCNPSWLKKNYIDLYNLIIDYNIKYPELSFKEKVYLYINNISDPPKCPQCNKKVKFIGTLNKGYSKYCSINCLNKSNEHKEKIKKTNQKKYNVDSHNQVKSIKEKKRNSYLRKYNVDNPMKLNEIKIKQKNTLRKKYDVDNPMKIKEVIKKRKNLIFYGHEKNIQRVINKLKENNTFIKHENGLFHFKCKKCNNSFNINSNLLNSRYINNSEICLICNPLKNFNRLSDLILNDFNDDVHFIINDRKQIKKEIDIYFPEHKLGVEINGIFWHSEKYLNSDYHINKTRLAEKNNIKLLHFFEDEILFKTKIVQSIIKTELNIFNDTINEENYYIEEIHDNKKIKNFLNRNHLNNIIDGDINLGLINNGEIVSIMILNNYNDNNYELSLFCDRINTKIINSCKNLLNYFIKQYKPSKISLFLDRRYSSDKIFTKLNFTQVEYSSVNCWYFKLNDYKKTRYKEVLNPNEFLRIYDCGYIKYELLCH